jgi:hypothetical protein
MESATAVLGLGLQEGLAMMFGTGVIFWAIWCLYQWEIKPNREAKRHQAQKQIEAKHRIHWQQLRRRTYVLRK